MKQSKKLYVICIAYSLCILNIKTTHSEINISVTNDPDFKQIFHNNTPTGDGVTIDTKVITEISGGQNSTKSSFKSGRKRAHAHTSAPQTASACPSHCTAPCSQVNAIAPEPIQAQPLATPEQQRCHAPHRTAHVAETRTPDIYVSNKNAPKITQTSHINTSVQQTRAQQKSNPLSNDDGAIVETRLDGTTTLLQPMGPTKPLSLLALFTPKLFIGTLGLGYSALLAKLLYTSYITLTKSDTWSSWHENIATTSESTASQELFAAINLKYAGAENVAEFLNPLVYFFNDVDKEIKELTHFIKLHDWLNYFKIAVLFPRQAQALELAAQKIQRLEHLKQLLVKSVGQYKVGA